MEVDRARAEEELRGDLPVREALRDEAGDLELLRGQLVARARVALARRLAARPQLDPRPLRPQRRAERLEAVERRSQVLARVDSAADAAEELAVRELGAGTLEGTGGLGVRGQGGQEEALGFALVLREERAAVQDAPRVPRRPRCSPPTPRTTSSQARGGLALARADRGFDPVEPTPEDDERRGDLTSSA